jgi:ATP-binding cassette, subfamily B, bacterial PglK
LDEATSALDSLTESKLMATIDSLKGQMTIIMIANRTRTLKKL